jgi:hypothetical protein
MSPFMVNDPYTSGTWTGRIITVPVVDHHGHTYEAAALDIETGPRVIRGGPDGDIVVNPEGPPPLLCRKGVAIVGPRELGIAPGRKVTLRGKLTTAYAVHFTQIERSGGGIADGISVGPMWEPDGELVIRLQGEPKVLKE